MGLITNIPYHKLCYKIIGAAMDVHNCLGPGHKESVYQRAMTLRLREIGLSCVAEQPVEILLDDQIVGLLYIDHLVEDAVVVEEKALGVSSYPQSQEARWMAGSYPSLPLETAGCICSIYSLIRL